MGNTLLVRRRRLAFRVPARLWKRNVRSAARQAADRIEFMSSAHHRVRNFVVSELANGLQPLGPATIATGLDLDTNQVRMILDELERRLTFLYRSDGRNVDWAYPVTAAETPHRVSFDNGERFFAAWGIDAIAAPFVQGRLRGEELRAVIDTECAHCGEPIRMEVDSDLEQLVVSDGPSPLVCTPFVDVSKLSPSIIDGFWQRSLFFWSEEHARNHEPRILGAYWNLAQSAHLTRMIQSALFAFPTA